MFERKITSALLAALVDTPVVFLQGARQTGKSTLARAIGAGAHRATYLSLDDISILAAAQSDPVGFVDGLRGGNVILDEVQRAPGLALAIKAAVDRDRAPGRFLLTGSANALVLPRLSDALVGRMELITLAPLAQSEIEGTEGDFVDRVFAGPLPATRRLESHRREITRRVLRGGYPEVVARRAEDRRRAWFESYLTTLLQRDVRDLAQVHGLNELPLLLHLIAARATATLNLSDLSRSARLPLTTLNRYLALLQATFLVQTIPPWASNASSRLVKTPKLLLNDSGLLAHLQGLTESALDASPTAMGMLLENFVGVELQKLASWSRARPQLLYFRTHDRYEVDFVLQDQAGMIVGIEVKAAGTVGAADFRGLHALADLAGKQFAGGIVLYSGASVVPFGERMYAVPIAALWSTA